LVYIALLVFYAASWGVVRPYIENTNRWHFGVAALLSVLVLVFFYPAHHDRGRSQALVHSAAGASEVTETLDSAASERITPSKAATAGEVTDTTNSVYNWIYSEQRDEPGDGTTRLAKLEAENTIELDHPYGEQRGFIILRERSLYGLEVLIGVKSGQILCYGLSSTTLKVTFDDGSIQRFDCTDATDGPSDIAFISDSSRFLKHLKSSKAVTIEAEFFQNGVQQMIFRSENLKWP
jgi:hypothetical protein